MCVVRADKSFMPAGAYMALHAVQQVKQTGEQRHDVPEIIQVHAHHRHKSYMRF